MSTFTTTSGAGAYATLAQLALDLGDIPVERIRLQPVPGTATEEDAVVINEAKNGALCELVDGVLVEKAMGSPESEIGTLLAHFLLVFVRQRKLGRVLTADGMIRFAGNLRMPDVSYFSKERLPLNAKMQRVIAGIVPDLAVEVLSVANSRTEMKRKRIEYFEAGSRLVWIVDPKKEIVEVWTNERESHVLAATDVLTGGDVLPGLEISLNELFGYDAE